MFESVHVLLDGILDYAGMFPPAKQPLEEALATYHQIQQTSPRAWMLGKFVCPAARLRDAAQWIADSASVPNLSMAVLGRQAHGAAEFVQFIEEDLAEIAWYRQACGDENLVEGIELALPATMDHATLPAALADAAQRLQAAGLIGWIEVPASPAWRDAVARTAEAIRALQGDPANPVFGMKIRCGGLAAEAFPAEDAVAHFLVQCRRANLRWKATAGLHHPCRYWDGALKVWHHGFLNVFVAALLARTHALAEADLVAILADVKGEHFRFEPERIAWKNWICTTDQIRAGRHDTATAFGSCSFDEPSADLAAMGLLDAGA